MFDSKDNQRQELECLRLASDCMQLASAVPSRELQTHLVLMARLWTALAEGRSADSPTTH